MLMPASSTYGYQGAYGTTYDVYTDSYGNIIGLAVPATSYTYGVFDVIAWQNSQALKPEYVAANVVDMTGAKAENVVINKDRTDVANTVPGNENEQGYLRNAENTSANIGDATPNNSYVSTDIKKNTAPYTSNSWTTSLYMFAKNAAGEYVISGQGTNVEDNQTIKTNVSNVWSDGIKNYATNDYTQYLVKTLVDSKYVYTAYTGFQKVPTLYPVKVSFFPAADGVYVGMVFVDATGANQGITSTKVAWINDNTSNGNDGGYNRYSVYIDGVLTPVYATANTTMDTAAADGLYTLSFNSDNKVVKVEPYVQTMEIDNVTGCNMNVVYNGGGTVADDVANLVIGEVKFYLVNADGSITALADSAAVQSMIDEMVYSGSYSAKKYNINALVQLNTAGFGTAVYVTRTAFEFKTITLKENVTDGTTLTLTDKASSAAYTIQKDNLKKNTTGTAEVADLVANKEVTLLLPVGGTAATKGYYTQTVV
jgi:hypothetical protein